MKMTYKSQKKLQAEARSRNKMTSMGNTVNNSKWAAIVAATYSAMQGGDKFDKDLITSIFTSDLGMRPMKDNPGFQINSILKFDGAVPIMSNHNKTLTTGAANYARGELLFDLGAQVQAESTDTDGYPVYSCWTIQQVYKANCMFCMIPFLALLENGESLASVDTDLENISSIYDAMNGNQENLVSFGPVYQSHVLGDGDEYILNFGLDLNQAANLYSNHYQRKELDEQTALVLQLGIILRSQAVATSHVGKGNVVRAYHIKPRSFGG